MGIRKLMEWLWRKRSTEQIGVCFEPLEPRLLLSGSGAAGAEIASADSQPDIQAESVQEAGLLFESTGTSGANILQQTQSQPETGTIADILAAAPAIEEFAAADPAPEAAISEGQTPPASSDTPKTPLDDAELQPALNDAAGAARELVFVDETVADYEQLIADLQGKDDNRSIEVVVLDSDRNGIEQISAILSERSNLSAVHFITHGADGMISLGDTSLNSSALQQNRDAISAWGKALTETGDILFYGCNITAGSAGQSLLDGIAELTGADVAASNDTTGHENLGGDWELETNDGQIETALAPSAAFQAHWNGLLATYTVTSTADSGAGSLRQAILNANANGGPDTISFNIAGSGTHTIAPTSALPTITGQVTIDGTTDDSFAANSNRPAIILAGTNAGIGVDGLVLTSTADVSTIRGLVVRDWGADGISIQAGSDNNFIVGNYIGRINTDGTAAAAGTQNEGDGVYVLGSNNTIGGTTAADRNVISGNDDGVTLDTGATGNIVIGNYIGTDATGSIAVGNTVNGGVWIKSGTSNNTIGGTVAGARNVISGNAVNGIYLEFTSGNTIVGNYIGTDATGILDLGNTVHGVRLESGSNNNTIGGTTAGARNVIAGNDTSGIQIADGLSPGTNSTGNVVQGNYIGVGADGTTALGHLQHGVHIATSADDNLIGGTAAGAGNIIANNQFKGVSVQLAGSTGITVLGNSIYANVLTGIDLGGDGVTANDAGDSDVGANNLQNFPVLTSASANAAGTTIVGTINSNANTTYRIEFFGNRPAVADASNGEGERFLGAITVTTDGSGNASVNTTLSNVWVNSGDRITATATVQTAGPTYGSTSEFAANVTATSTGIIVVDTTSDVSDGTTTSIANLGANRGADGRISLREAIVAANNTANGGTPDKIVFDIAGAGPHTINVGSALPTITQAVVIDGSTEPNYTSNVPVVRIDGATAGASVIGVTIGATGGGSTIRGLIITRFTGDGINVASGANNVTIAGNWIGTTGTGSTGVGNADDGLDIYGSNAIIGGTGANDRNVITNNGDEGIDLKGSGVTGHLVQGNYVGVDPDGASGGGNVDVGIAIMSGTGNTIGGTSVAARNVISKNKEGMEINTSDNVVQGNYIGTDVTGTLNRGNRVDNGVQLQGSSTNNQVGGTAAGAGNLIAFNASNGVDVVNGSGDLILGNAIHSNTLIGINLGTAGVTANDANDVDTGANNLQNFPLLTSATTTGAQVTITGTLNSIANTQFRIEFFASTTQDGSGYGEGKRYLGFANVTTDGSGNATIGTTLTATVAAGEFISATATRSNAGFTVFTDTSEFALDITAAPPPGITVTPTSGLTTKESGAMASFTAVLNSAPTASVTFTVASGDAGEATVFVPSVTFTTSNWSFAQTIFVRGVDDDLVDGGQPLTIVLGTASSSDPNYNGIDVPDVSVTNQDDPFERPPLGGETRVNATTVGTQTLAVSGRCVAMDAGGNYVVVWESAGQDGDQGGIYGQRFDSAGAAIGGEFRVNTATTGNQTYASVAMDTAGNFLVVWSGNGPGDTDGVFAQRYDANGNKLGGEFRVNAAAAGVQSRPVAGACPMGGYVVAWSESDVLYMVQVDSAGALVNPTTLAAAGTIDGSIDVDVAADGSYVVAWEEQSTVQVACFEADGSLRYQTSVAAGMSFYDFDPSVAISANGEFGVAWAPYDFLVDSITYVYFQRFQLSDGALDGASVAVAADVGGSPSLAMDDNGNAFVSYFSGSSIIKATLDATDAFVGAKRIVNTTVTGTRNLPSIVSDANGNQIAVWSGEGTGDTTGVFVQRYGSFAAPTNDAPTATNLSAAETYTEDTAKNLTAIVVSDVDSAMVTATLTLSNPTAGSMNTGTSGAVTSTYNAGTGVWTASGAIANVNALLAGLTFTPTANYNSSFTIATSISDGVAAPITGTKAITGTAVADHILTVDTVANTSDGDTTTIDTLLANKGTDGFVSLREAILAANNTANGGTPDQISFNIAGAGVHTIQPDGALPTITDAVVIDGYTQPGAAANTLAVGSDAVLRIVLDGTTAGAATPGLAITAGNSTVRGLVINNFTYAGIHLDSGSGNTIVGNYIGTDVTGTIAAPNGQGTGFDGILIGYSAASSNNVIGGAAPADRNVISGNSGGGIWMVASNGGNVIRGNYIGVNASGNAALGNGQHGIILQGPGNSILNNVISGNGSGSYYGIYLPAGADSTTIQGNLIGTNAAGTTAIPNINDNIYIESDNNTIGGTLAGQGNTIANSTAKGIVVIDGATGNAILGNSVYGNSGIGIDLRGNGVTVNNGTTNASLANYGMDYPQFNSASLSGNTLSVAGFVGSVAGQATFANARVEIFKSDGDSSGYGEGRTYLGYLTSDVSGNFNGTLDVSGKGLSAGDKVTATATNGTNNTSEFGLNIVVNNTAPVLAGTSNLTTINEDPASNPGTLVSALISGQITDTDPGALTGIAVTSVDNTNGTWQYSTNGGSNWSNFGSPSATASRLLTANGSTYVRFVPTANWNGIVANGLAFRAWDQTAGTAGGTINTNANGGNTAFSSATASASITVNPVADTPSVTNATTNEDTQTTTGLVISRNVADGAEVTHFKITGITNGTLYKNDGTTQITNGTFITFAEGNAGLKFTPTANFSGSGSFTIQASTSNGDGGLGGSTVNATITVNAVNDGPVASITPATYAATEQVALTLKNTGLSISDVDAASGSMTVTLSVTEGTLTVTAGGSGALVSNSGTSSVTIAGTVTQINNLLSTDATSTVSYTDGTDTPSASATLTLQVNDNGNTGGGPLTNSDTATINIMAVNDAPSLAGIEGAALAYTENAGAVVITSSLSASDVDNINLTGATVTISANYAIGQDALGFTNQLGITGSWDVITGVLTLSGTTSVANYETALRSITYTNSSDNPSTLTRTVSFVVTDGSVSSAPATRNIVVSPVNDAPQVFAPASISVVEDVPSVINGFLLYDVDGGGGTETATFTVASGALSATSAGGVVVGGTANALTLTGTLSDLNTFVSGNGLTFTTASNDTSTVTLGISLNDGGNAGSGGPLSSSVTNVTLNVTPVNDAPVITSASLTVSEGQTVTLSGANFGITDPDDAGFIYTVSGVTGGFFQLSSAAGTPITTFTSADLSGGIVQFVDDGNEVAPSFSVKVNDGDVDSNTLAATITYNPVNDAPVLGAIGNQSVNEGATLTFTATATDADLPSQTLTYSLDAASLALGMSIDANTGAFSWTPSEAQGGLTPSVTITVTDNGTGNLTDSETFTITVGEINTAPVLAAIGNQSVSEGATLSFTATATDADLPAQSLTYSLDAASLALGMTINSSTGAFSWTPTEAQGGLTPSVTITVTDNGTGNLTDSETFTITVNEINTAPVLGAIGNQSVNEGATLSFTATATDADLPAQSLTYSLDAASLALGMTINSSTGAFSWTPTEAQGGLTPSVTITVTDNGTGTLTDSETFTITVNDINVAPVLAAIGNQAVNEGATLSFTASATDADLPIQTLTYSLDAASLALGMTINSSTGAFSWTTTEAQGGLTPSVTVTVTDNGTGTLTDSETFTITVNDINVAPVLSAIGNQTVNEGATLSFTATATDADLPGQTLTYSLDAGSLALGMTIDANTGVFSWTPTEAQGGLTPSVTITVTDNGTGTLTDSETFTITVNDTNVAPLLAAIGNQVVNEGATLSFAASATDADLPTQSLTYSLDAASLALGMSIDANTGVFSWTPAENQDGVHAVTVTVTDNGTGTLSDSETFNITVGEVNVAPILGSIGNQTVNEGSTLTFTAIATDTDVPANTLTYSLSGTVPTGASITTGGVFTWTPTEAQGPGSYSFDVVVSDGAGGTDSETITVTVNEANIAPVLAAIANQTIAEASTLTFTATATDTDVPADTLTYSLSGTVPTGASITTGGVFTWTPTEAQGPGSYSFDVVVSDGAGGTDSETITVTVNEANIAPVLAVIGNQTVNEGSTLSFTASATDADLPSQTLTYSLDAASLALGMSIDANTGAFSWTPTEAQGGLTPSVTVTVTDNGTGTLTDSETFTITVNDINTAPVLTAIGNQTVNEGATLSFTATATDADLPGQTLTYSLDAASIALGMSIDANTGVFSWTPTEAQGGLTPSVTVTVTDNGTGTLTDSETFTITVNDINVAPVLSAIGNQTVNEGATLSFTATATDADLPGQTLTYSLDAASLALGMSIDANTGAFSWTPTEAQGGLTPSVTITVTDNGTGNLTDSETFTITVNEINTAPVLGAIGNQSVNEGATLSFTATANDADLPAQTLSYSLDAASIALGMTIDANTGVFSWTPTEAQGGLTPSVTVTVTDNGSGNLTDSETFTITVNEINTAPVLAAIGNQTVNEGATLSFTATATDADLPGQTLTYSLDAASLALGMSIDANTGVFSWTPTEAQGGLTPSVTVTVTDNGTGLLTDSETFSITVNEINTAPVLTAIGNQSVNEGATLSFTATATDADLPGQTLTYSLDAASIALGMSIDANTGVFTWTPTEAQGGLTPSVTITVTDNGTGNLTDSETFTITVNDINVAPVLAAIGNQAVNEGATLSFTATATDADLPGQTLTYSLDAGSLALGMTIDANTGVFSWTPTEAQGGLTPSVTITVTDNGTGNLTDSETFTITVNDINVAPVLAAIGNQSVNEGVTLSFTATATDADLPGQTLTYSLDAASLALGMGIDANTGVFSWTPTEAQGGLTPSVTITVTDNGTGNLTDSETFTITVNDINVAPVLAAIGNQSVNEGATLSFTASATDADLPGQTLTYSLDAASLALGMSIDANTGAFSWTPTEAQGGLTPSVTVTVTDNGTGTLTDSETFTITVYEINTAPVLTAIGNQTVNEGATLSFTATATDADLPGQTLTYSLDAASIALGMSIDANTGVFSWTPTEAQGGLTPSVTITVTDNGTGNLTDSETFTITVNEINTAPVLGAIGNQSVNEGATLSFTATATDADLPAQSLTYSLDAASLALGMTINSSTGAFSWIPTEAQGGLTPSVTITVTDNGTGNLTDSETFTITVNDINTAPVLAAIGNQSVSEGATLSFAATATDADLPGQSLSYSLDAASIALGMSIDANTGAFTWTPSEAQGGLTPSVTITVTDNGTGNMTDSETFTITVGDANLAPVLAAIGNQSVNEGATLSFTATATDADLPANTLTYSLSGTVPTGASITTGGVFTWTPTEAQGPGSYSFDVVVSDGAGGTDSETITVTVNEANIAPVLAAIGNQTIAEGSTLTFTATATDTDVPANTLTYSLSGTVPTGASINATTGVFSWTPTEAQGPGSYSFDVVVSDGTLTDSETITVTVNEVNAAPVLGSIGNQTVNEGSTLTFTGTAIDADLPGQALTYSLDAASLALGMTINSSTGAFSWTPTEAQGGLTPSVTVTVTDNGSGNLTDSETFTITVNDINTAPVLAAIGNQSVNEGATLSFTATATDADLPGQTLTYSLDAASLALGMSIDANTGVFSWTPTEAQGSLTPSVTITVTDNGTGNLTDSETFTITVNDINVAPVLAAIGNQSVNEGATLTFTASASDADVPAQSLTYSLDAASLALGMTIDANTGVFSWTPTEAQGGLTPSVTITVTDNGSGNLTDSETFTITVNDINTAPVLAAIGNRTVNEGATLSFTASATDADLPGQTLTYSLDAASLALGMTINSSTGVFSWTPTESQGGLTPSVTITVTDNGTGNLTDSETFTITVGEVNTAPVTTPVTLVAVAEDSGARVITQAELLANADDLDGDSLTAGGLFIASGNGTLVDNGDGTWTYTPDLNDDTAVSFGYVISDGTVSVAGSATMDISPVNDAPVIGGASTGAVTEDVDADTDGLLEVSGVLSISDPDIGEASFLPATIVGTYGSLRIDAAGNWHYTADNRQAAIQQLDAGENTSDVLTVTTADGTTHTVTITINGAKDSPVGGGSTDPADEKDPDPKPGGDTAPVQPQPQPEPVPVRNEPPPPEKIPIPSPRPMPAPGAAPPRWIRPVHFVPTISLSAAEGMNGSDHGAAMVRIGFMESLKWGAANAWHTGRMDGKLPPDAAEFFSVDALAQRLDHVQKQINDALEADAKHERLIIGAATGVAASVLVGYVVWAFRAASLLLGALSALPMWRCFDPLPVLIGKNKKRDDDEEKKPGAPEPEVDEKRVRELFESEKAVKAHPSSKGRTNWYEAL